MNSRIEKIYRLGIKWLANVIRRPFSSWLSKATFVVGSLIVATPMFEHLLFSAILKKALGVDLGIEVPDAEAYFAGGVIIALALAHNLMFVRLNQKFAVSQLEVATSTYREFWALVDTMVDATFRLASRYCTPHSAKDSDLVTAAHDAISRAQRFARLNRPFLLSPEVYETFRSLSVDCRHEVEAFEGCVYAKQFKADSYDFVEAEKVARSLIRDMKVELEAICSAIQEEVDLPLG